MPRRPLQLALIFLSFLSLFQVNLSPALAQQAASATLYPPALEDFPTITAYLDVRDAQGKFLSGLLPADVQVLEDGQPLPVGGLTELSPGVQFALAITPGQAFGIRDGRGNTRYSYLAEALTTWARSIPGTNQDILNFVPTGGSEVDAAPPAQWLIAVQNYLPDSTQAASLEVLSRAVELVSAESPREGMGRAVLFVTPVLQPEAAIGLQGLATRAREAGVRLFVWMVASADTFTSAEAAELEELATQTGGAFFAFSGRETIPDPENYLAPLRNVYRLVYASRLTASGSHQIVTEIAAAGGKVTTAPHNFDITIQPPHPMFVSLPAQIVRARAEITGKTASTPAAEAASHTWLPESQAVEVLIEFPDEHPRPVITSTLFVDGEIVATNSRAPFEKFTWDLSAYTQSGRHQLRVEVMDSLGLRGMTIESPVEVVVEQPNRGVLSLFTAQGLVLAGVVVVLAGGVLALVLVLGGRIRPRALAQASAAEARASKTTPRSGARSRLDPVTQPIEAGKLRDTGQSPSPGGGASAAAHKSSWINRLQWPQRHVSPQSLAVLTPLDSDDLVHPAPVPLTGDEIVIGHDSTRTALTLDDASVEDVHARLRREAGAYRLADAGTVAGTWVNYTPVSTAGVLLEQGDLVHIGRVGFRFTLRQPECTRKPVITSQDRLL